MTYLNFEKIKKKSRKNQEKMFYCPVILKDRVKIQMI